MFLTKELEWCMISKAGVIRLQPPGREANTAVATFRELHVLRVLVQPVSHEAYTAGQTHKVMLRDALTNTANAVVA
jgi:hypothetical protein